MSTFIQRELRSVDITEALPPYPWSEFGPTHGGICRAAELASGPCRFDVMAAITS